MSYLSKGRQFTQKTVQNFMGQVAADVDSYLLRLFNYQWNVFINIQIISVELLVSRFILSLILGITSIK